MGIGTNLFHVTSGSDSFMFIIIDAVVAVFIVAANAVFVMKRKQ